MVLFFLFWVFLFLLLVVFFMLCAFLFFLLVVFFMLCAFLFFLLVLFFLFWVFLFLLLVVFSLLFIAYDISHDAGFLLLICHAVEVLRPGNKPRVELMTLFLGDLLTVVIV